MQDHSQTERRKTEHIKICMEEQVTSSVTTGLESYRFLHAALPEINFSQISLQTGFINKMVRTPFLISSMTGGTTYAKEINEKLAEAAEIRGWVMALGSMRAAIEKEELVTTFQIRKKAPTVPVIANLGAVQLNNGYGIDECKRIVDMVEADALVLHLNSMQEVFQAEGDTNFHQLITKIAQVCKASDVPVGVKEVGFGFDSASASKLIEAGVSFIDVAGAGGTSWIEVEKHRNKNKRIWDAAEAFLDWGIPTATSILEVRKVSTDLLLIGSGGIRTGVEAAKAIALGADFVGFGRSLLQAATSSVEEVLQEMERIEFECKSVMFGIGASDLQALKTTERLFKKE
ncbi:type 2 isopentenyl-diphosphate Delta-isomerase [Brevibacillus daliensis]|uniref:type 2 isopentenyl-diphosphate Delta-isomerase n=1 Tax=Brevibacillus daliensis TaxID=2892995 RepID=UPI001E3E1D64|nr:type 2 isopentenyl-diphosphate Delta-isomerase [Brevibacillus daliensis]